MSKPVSTHILNGVRGALIGTAEAVPGVSGGTVALITGVYEALIASAGHLLSALKLAAGDLPRGNGLGRAGVEFRRVDWAVIIAVLIGMVTALLVAAQVLAPLVEHNRRESYAVFFGLVLASLWVPYTLSGQRWRARHYLVALAVAMAAFLLTGMPPAEVTPTPILVMAAAAVAVCALVLPGVSGSFFLLTMGLYTATMSAISERDLGYLGVFLLGAVIGLAFFVKLLQWLLEHHHHITLVVMTGLLAGSLRALWPWQTEQRELLAPTVEVPTTVALAAAGFATVVVILVVERRVSTRRDTASTLPDSSHQPTP